MFVGRDPEMGEIAALLQAARDGTGDALCLHGEPGIGKSTLLDAAERAAPDFTRLETTGVAADISLAHAGLLDIVLQLRADVPNLHAPQRAALEVALGWATRSDDVGDSRYLVAAATMSLLAMAAARRPVLILIDDVHWVDRETVSALTFAARRLRRDPVVFLLATRDQDEQLTGVRCRHLTGLALGPAHQLLAGVVTKGLSDRLVELTSGNPLALTAAAKGLTPEQRRGSAPLPDRLQLDERLTSPFAQQSASLSDAARRAVVLVAAAGDSASGPLTLALAAEGLDPDTTLAEAERAGLLRVSTGRVEFRHPLARAAVWSSAEVHERRSAHRSLAAAFGDDPGRQLRHLAEATTGFDDELARRLRDQSRRDRARHGYAAASQLAERAAELTSSALDAADLRAEAVEDAFVAGNGSRVRELAATVLDGAARDDARARVLLALGSLEEYAGSVPRARELLADAADTGHGLLRLRALAELAAVSYRLGEPTAMAEAARAIAVDADRSDAEQELLACYSHGSALAFAGRWADAHEPMSRALDLIQTDSVLRDDPHYLTMSLLAAGWMGEPARAAAYVDARLDAARSRGALGVLPMALSLIAGGAMVLGEHQIAYAYAGEAVELGSELGYVADVAIAYGILSWESAARGLHDQAAESLAEARRLEAAAGVADTAVQIELVDAFCALCRGDLERVMEVLEWRLEVDDGRLPRGDYPLSVAPDLVEAYVGLGEREKAKALARRHIAEHRDSEVPDVRGDAARLRGMIATDDAEAHAAFVEACSAHAGNSFQAARTRLVHGARLRRAGQRRAAREQLRAAADVFASVGLDAWRMRAESELAATGERRRRGPVEGDQLSPQETRVAVLVARGRSNREIAAALFLSPKTVEHHVSTALRKRGMRSRTELAVAFAPNGGVGDTGQAGSAPDAPEADATSAQLRR